MHPIIVSSFFILIFGFFGTVIFLMIRQKQDIDKRLQESTLSSNQDFMSKMEFFFNRFSQARDDNLRQTVSVVDPIGKVLDKLQKQIDEMQKYRISSDSNIQNNIHNVIKLQESLTQETHKLRNVLRKPNSRGKWGEVQLQRIAEIAGMLPFCEFETQNTSFDGIRPDMTVKIPNGGTIFVDAKTPLDAYFKGLDEEYTNEEVSKENLKSIKTHIYNLGNKEYWKKAKSPDFVVMFIPMEHIWLSALEEDPYLIEYASERNVIVATPMTLIGLMKTISVGWSQVKFAEEAENLKKSFQFIEELIKPTFANLDKMQKFQNQIIDISNEIRVNIRKIDGEMSKYEKTESVLNINQNTEENITKVQNVTENIVINSEINTVSKNQLINGTLNNGTLNNGTLNNGALTKNSNNLFNLDLKNILDKIDQEESKENQHLEMNSLNSNILNEKPKTEQLNSQSLVDEKLFLLKKLLNEN